MNLPDLNCHFEHLRRPPLVVAANLCCRSARPGGTGGSCGQSEVLEALTL